MRYIKLEMLKFYNSDFHKWCIGYCYIFDVCILFSPIHWSTRTQVLSVLLYIIVTYICVSLFVLQPGRGRVEYLHLEYCTLNVDLLVDLVRHVCPPDGLPRVEMMFCALIHGGEAPGECPATPDEQLVCVTHLDIKWSKKVTLAALEAVIHVLTVKTLTLMVSCDHNKHQTFNQC